MTKIVLDSSLVAKWYLRDESDIHIADTIVGDYLTDTIQIYFPPLVIYEIGNILFTASLLKRITKSDGEKSFNNFIQHPFEYKNPIYTNVLKLAYQFIITFYDAAYIALAKDLNCPFYTGDEKLYKKVKNDLSFVYSLKEY
ncbi:type II toxin-antitoxin system VapC family toxin [Candidatus Roizmanbacteria bacterium]|nr:type II toxin-antitoxin system VapC family toxin [Candidatus Roizmanbacteria bacterium]